MCMLLVMNFTTAVNISLSTSTAIVVEGNGTVEVCATLTGPAISATGLPISVPLITTDGTKSLMVFVIAFCIALQVQHKLVLTTLWHLQL